MSYYFISYSRADQQIALKLANDLCEAGISVWCDQIDIRPSERWDRAIEAGLRGSAGLLLVMSPRSVASENVLDEISLTMDAGKPVVPLMIEACQPPLRLARVQYIDATHSYAEALERCKAAIALRPAGDAAPAQAMLAPSHVKIAAVVLDRLAQRLTVHLGPVARHLVERESQAAIDDIDLIRRLSERIPEAKEREAFRSQAMKDL